MRFADPYWLYALLVLPLLGIAMWRMDRTVRSRLQRLVAPRLLASLTDANAARLYRRLLTLIGLGSLFVALARPQWGTIEQSINRRGRDIVIAIDTSKSMLATDIVPSRLSRAKLAAQDIIRSMPGERFALLAFAGDAQLETPLTVDYTSVLTSLNGLSINSIDRGGSNLAAAIRAAQLAFGKAEGSYRALVLLTDGEETDQESSSDAAREATDIRIFTIGIGSTEGSTIPMGQGANQVLKDRNGSIVRTRLDEEKLREIAEQSGGFYSRLDPTTVRHVVQDGLDRLEYSAIDQRSLRTPVERYQWPLLSAFVLLLIAYLVGDQKKARKSPAHRPAGVAAAVALLASLLTQRADAVSGLDLYQKGDFEGAHQRFEEELKRAPGDPVANFNAGDTAYKLGKYDEAFESYSQAILSQNPRLRQKSYYNAGNALFKQGDSEEELTDRLTRYYDARYQYHQSLALDPQDASTRKNLAILEQRIKQTEEQQQQEQQQQQQMAQQRRDQRQRNQRRRQQQRQRGNQQEQQPDQQQQQQQQQQDQQQQQSPGNEGEQQESNEGGGDENNEEATPTPGQRKEGELRQNEPNADQQPPAEANRKPQNPGQMTENDAKGLLDSLRDEEDRVDLMNRKSERGVLRDW